MLIELRQKLMQRFLEGEMSQEMYDHFLADIEKMESEKEKQEAQNAENPSVMNRSFPVRDLSQREKETDTENDSDIITVEETSSLTPCQPTQPAWAMNPMSYGSDTDKRHFPPGGAYQPNHGIPLTGNFPYGPGIHSGNIPPEAENYPNYQIKAQSGRYPERYPASRNAGAGFIFMSPEMASGVYGQNYSEQQGLTPQELDPDIPIILPQTLLSLAPGQALEVWWHRNISPESCRIWRETGVPIKMGLALNSYVNDEALKYLSTVTNIRELNLASTNVTDRGVNLLGNISALELLNLTSLDVTGEHIPELTQLRQLSEITLTSAPFTDVGMDVLTQLSALEVLRLDDTRITDAGLENISMLRALKSLNLQGDMISDAGLEAIACLTGLEELYLGGTIPYQGGTYESPITNKGVALLKTLTKLHVLHLNDTQITDAALLHIGKLTNLEELNLADTYITDSGLHYLRGLTRIKRIIVDGTDVTISGVRKYFGKAAVRRFSGARVGALRKLGRFFGSPWSRKN